MFRFVVVLAVLACAVAFAPAGRFGAHSMQMNAQKQIAKAFGAAAIAASFVMPAVAKEGATPNYSFFGESPSSPFTFEENREDPIYSPYSPYGNGAAAVYNKVKGDKTEIGFWQNQLANCVKRVDNVPALTKKADWQSVRSELTSYAYNMREAMLRYDAHQAYTQLIAMVVFLCHDYLSFIRSHFLIFHAFFFKCQTG